MKTATRTTAAVATLTLALAATGVFAADASGDAYVAPGSFADVDQNNDGHISRAESDTVWSRLDRDDDGRVSAAEYDAYLQQKSGDLADSREPYLRERTADTSGEQLSQTEGGKSLEGERVVPPGVPRDPRTGAVVDQGMQPGIYREGGGWQQADADGDGAVSQSELNRYVANLGESAYTANREVHFGPGAFTEEVFNDTGVPDEQALRNAWPRLDRDSDGTLDRAEFSAFESAIEMR